MKISTLSYCLTFLFGLTLLSMDVGAQPNQIVNANGTFLCPNKAYNFSSNNSSSSAGCSVFWNIGGGTALLSNPTTAGLVQVSFADAPSGAVTLSTAYSGCSVTASNGTS